MKISRKTLNHDSVAIANQNANKRHFAEKFTNRRSRRVYQSIPASPWAQVLHAFREKHDLYAKQAADILQVPCDTYRAWECGRHTPQRMVQQEIARRMKFYGEQSATAKAPC